MIRNEKKRSKMTKWANLQPPSKRPLHPLSCVIGYSLLSASLQVGVKMPLYFAMDLINVLEQNSYSRYTPSYICSTSNRLNC